MNNIFLGNVRKEKMHHQFEIPQNYIMNDGTDDRSSTKYNSMRDRPESETEPSISYERKNHSSMSDREIMIQFEFHYDNNVKRNRAHNI